MPGSTPNQHYPYPLDADPVDVAIDIKKLADALDADIGFHGAKVRRLANQSIPSMAETILTWDTEDVDTDGYFTVGSGTFTIPAARGGAYACSVTTVPSSQLGGSTYMRINVGFFVFQAVQSSSMPFGGISGVAFLDPGQTVTFSIYNNVAGAQTYTGRAAIARVGA